MHCSAYASTLAQELRAQLEVEDEEALKRRLESLGTNGWHAWLLSHEAETLEYLGSTEVKRAKKKRWQEPGLRPLLLLAAYQLSNLASEMLGAAPALSKSGACRVKTEVAAAKVLELRRMSVQVWPLQCDPPQGWVWPKSLFD